jgi:hypothetical protein
VCAVTARTYACKTMGCAGVGPTTAESQRRWAGPQWARPVERLAWQSKNALRRNVASFRSLRVSARARLRSRRASSSPVGTETAVRSPARAPGQWHGVSPVRFAAVPSLLGKKRGRYDPAVVVFVPEIPLEPRATRAGLRDTDEVLGLRLHCPDEGIHVTRTSPHGAQGGDRSARVLGDIRHGHRLFVDVHADEACARLRHG